MVGGFKEGVNMAMRKCRCCMATDQQIQTKVLSDNYNVASYSFSLYSLKRNIFGCGQKRNTPNSVSILKGLV